MITRILLYFERLIFGSEKLFKFMILNEIEDNSLFIEVGSSDLAETKMVLEKKTNVNIIVFEPDLRNINSYDYQILKNKRLKIIKKILSDSHGKKFFYFHKDFSNLNQLNKPSKKRLNYFYKKKISSTTLKKEIKKIRSCSKFVIKMDIEGFEYELIKNNLDFFRTKKKISILIELHPNYYFKNQMKNLIKKLIKFGYYFKLVESAGSVRPNVFKKKKLYSFKKKYSKRFICKFRQ